MLHSLGHSILLSFLLTTLTACGGNKLLKEGEPLVLNQPLAQVQDDYATIHLDWVIVKDGPGSWAKNANWDEYLLRVQNDSQQTLEVISVRAWDSQGVAQAPLSDRKQLTAESKETAKRYKKEGVEVQAGASAGALWVASGTALYGGSALGIGALYSGSTAAAGTAVALIAAAPVIAITGVVVAVNNSKVNKEIGKRNTQLPVVVEPGKVLVLDLFLPLVPSPSKIEILYSQNGQSTQLSIDLLEVLPDLHIVKPDDSRE
jgi:hypothetical protein